MFQVQKKPRQESIHMRPCGESGWVIDVMVYNVAGTNLQVFNNNNKHKHYGI